MREKIEAVAKMADARPDIAWVSVVILSHGRQKLGEDEIMGVNGEGLKKSDVSGHNEKRFRYFRMNKTLLKVTSNLSDIERVLSY